MTTVIWTESADGETLAGAFRRITGRELDLRRPLFEEVASGYTRYHFKGGLEVTLPADGPCTISRAAEGGGR